jgi:hypothetical protein
MYDNTMYYPWAAKLSPTQLLMSYVARWAGPTNFHIIFLEMQ